MPDRDKVIKGLEKLRTDLGYGLPDRSNVVIEYLNSLTGAIALLKEQEAKPVDLYGKDDWYGLVCVCPDCKAEWMGDESNTHFCPNCGRTVKWE